MAQSKEEHEYAMALARIEIAKMFYIPSTAFARYLKAPFSRGAAEMSNRIADEFNLPKIDLNDASIVRSDGNS